MAKNGSIVVVDDDLDDQEIIADIIKELGILNEVVFFTECDRAFNYLKASIEQPFIIICDVNLPKLNGLDFKLQIDNDSQLRQKAIPFIFLSTSDAKATVTEAYTKMTVQGFFKKKASIDQLKEDLSIIIAYWKTCRHPNAD